MCSEMRRVLRSSNERDDQSMKDSRPAHQNCVDAESTYLKRTLKVFGLHGSILETIPTGRYICRDRSGGEMGTKQSRAFLRTCMSRAVSGFSSYRHFNTSKTAIFQNSMLSPNALQAFPNPAEPAQHGVLTAERVLTREDLPDVVPPTWNGDWPMKMFQPVDEVIAELLALQPAPHILNQTPFGRPSLFKVWGFPGQIWPVRGAAVPPGIEIPRTRIT